MTDRIKKTEKSVPGKKKILFRLARYVFHYWYLFAAAIALTIFSNHLTLLGPKYSGDAIDAIAGSSGVNFSMVFHSLLRMGICFLAAAGMSYLLSVLMIFISQKIVYTMRRQLFEKLTRLPVSFFDANATGDIVSRFSYDMDVLNSSLSQDTVQVMTSLYTVIGSLIFMLRISPPLVLVFCFTVPASILFTRFRAVRVRPLFRARSAKLGGLNGYAEEMLSGCRAITLYHREEEMNRRFDVRNRDAMKTYFQAECYGAMQGPCVNLISNLSLSMVVMAGGILYMFSQNGKFGPESVLFLTLGGVAQFVQYSRKFSGPINEFANILHEFQSAFSAAERIFRILDEEPEPVDAPQAAELIRVRGSVEFRDVSFGYVPERPVLDHFNLCVSPGQTVAIVGPTGAGKTTIINLLMRFYDVDCGSILIDGRPVRELTRSSLRRAFAMVLQDTWLFHGSIYDNIAYGRDGATREQVEAAARSARIHSYISRLPEGYDTVLSEGGANISKGQRQLIAIARAMLSRAPMLILDEATSNVDSRTEKLIQQAMEELMRNRTCFVIAHRLSTIRSADRILVLQDGKITEQGTDEELMALGGFYSSLQKARLQ